MDRAELLNVVEGEVELLELGHCPEVVELAQAAAAEPEHAHARERRADQAERRQAAPIELQLLKLRQPLAERTQWHKLGVDSHLQEAHASEVARAREGV